MSARKDKIRNGLPTSDESLDIMTTEIEWNVDDSSTRRTIFKTPAPRSHRNVAVLLLVVAFGVALGVIYRSIPEPPKPLMPTRIPIRSIVDTIDQEAHALELANDPQLFMKLQDPIDSQWRQQQLNSFKAWGVSPTHFDLYTIVDSGTIGIDHAWAEVNQLRDGQFFRETRFYRLRNNQWVRARPDLSFWGEKRAIHTEHFDLVFRAGDDFQMQIVGQQLENVYTRVCDDLNCNGSGLTSRIQLPFYTLVMLPEADSVVSSNNSTEHLTITLTSPRISGLYFHALYDDVPGNDQPIERLAINKLNVPYFIAKIASGGSGRWSNSMKGDMFVVYISGWEANRIIPNPGLSDDAALSQLRDDADKNLITLDELWDATPPYATTSHQDMMNVETWSVIRFIESQFGREGVARFLNAIGPANSLSQAIENGLNISYAEFEQDWRDWLKN